MALALSDTIATNGTPTIFHGFSKLPNELRIMVWQHAYHDWANTPLPTLKELFDYAPHWSCFLAVAGRPRHTSNNHEVDLKLHAKIPNQRHENSIQADEMREFMNKPSRITMTLPYFPQVDMPARAVFLEMLETDMKGTRVLLLRKDERHMQGASLSRVKAICGSASKEEGDEE